jgi:hypothetical protein
MPHDRTLTRLAALAARSSSVFARPMTQASAAFRLAAPRPADPLSAALRIRAYPARGKKLAQNLPSIASWPTGLADRRLSTPLAAGGGGRRPAFTGDYRPAKMFRWHRLLTA